MPQDSTPAETNKPRERESPAGPEERRKCMALTGTCAKMDQTGLDKFSMHPLC